MSEGSNSSHLDVANEQAAQQSTRRVWPFVLTSVAVCGALLLFDGQIRGLLVKAQLLMPGSVARPNVTKQSTQSRSQASGNKPNLENTLVGEYDGVWKNSDGDLIQITRAGQKLNMKLLSSSRISNAGEN